ncbi:HpcH/HpaI aldolase/citrate lyase family protein [Jannaschia formosa]|uniref:HpcH/HpaI aldolase/citrate lyase family protein n=1 Tax=Jannaschia formosa TaxID=2259592 RepID=UPI000E1BA3D0|nr:CoA ester lyase [Jannaschia formosa]TFL16515.1 CoA ester lyase [Jannaschia formosa]
MTDRVLRSLLFTPATRVAAFDKALGSGADCVCLDLEDAVPPASKAGARPAALDWLSAGGEGPLRGLRINALSTAFGMADMADLARAAPGAGLVMLPKVGSAEEVRLAAAVLDEAGSGLTLAALVESAAGLAAVDGIAAASPRLTVLVFGGVDLSADLGADPVSDTMRVARARIVQAARAAGRDVLDVPELAFRDLDGVARAARLAAREGFTGKAAIHPANVAAINDAFTPDAEAIAEARRVVEAFEAAPSGLAELDGKLIEAPVVKAMRGRLARARAAGVL